MCWFRIVYAFEIFYFVAFCFFVTIKIWRRCFCTLGPSSDREKAFQWFKSLLQYAPLFCYRFFQIEMLTVTYYFLFCWLFYVRLFLVNFLLNIEFVTSFYITGIVLPSLGKNIALWKFCKYFIKTFSFLEFLILID